MAVTCFKTLPNLQTQINIFIDEVDNVDYRYKAVRLESFKNWPATYVKPERLATAGFYFTGEGDLVRCFDCRLELFRWKEGDDPIMIHRRRSPMCRFICNVPCDNIPIDFELSTSPSLTKEDTNISGSYSMERDWFTSRLEKAKHPYYSIYSLRLDTFENWPTSKTQTKQQLAEAGFFYTKTEDHVLCFYCGLGLRDWTDNEDPWEMHVLWMPDCFYLLEIKGQEYVNSLQISEQPYLRQIETQPLQDTEATLGSVIEENSGPNSGISNIPIAIDRILRNMSLEDKSVEDKNNITKSLHRETNSSSSTGSTTLLCEICCDNKRNVAFVTCMHIVVCLECSKKLKTCPVCRQDILYTLPVNFV